MTSRRHMSWQGEPAQVRPYENLEITFWCLKSAFHVCLALRCHHILSVFLPQTSNDVMTSHRDVTWRQDVMPSYDVTWRQDVTPSYVMTKWTCTGQAIWRSGNYVFQSSDLDLWPWPSNSSEILSRSTLLPNFGSVCQRVQPWERWQTDALTGPILYPQSLTREGINEICPPIAAW